MHFMTCLHALKIRFFAVSRETLFFILLDEIRLDTVKIFKMKDFQTVGLKNITTVYSVDERTVVIDLDQTILHIGIFRYLDQMNNFI